jgi:Flp pilus assembly protein TadG
MPDAGSNNGANAMKKNCKSFVRRALDDQRGQMLVLVALGMLVLMGVAGLTIDAGHAYLVRDKLQSTADAAALAGADSVYTNSSAASVASQYVTNNLSAGEGTVTPNITTPCLNVLIPAPSTCANSTPANPPNAVKVNLTAAVPTYFMRLFGFTTVNVGATAIASMQGLAQPWNVAIILDATGSMGSQDPYCPQSGSTAEQCAMTGIQTMLLSVHPCAGGQAGCTSSSANAKFRVSLFSFPNVPVTQVADDYNCKGTPTANVYSLPAIPASGSTSAYTPFAYSGTTAYTATYQITPHSADMTNIDANGFTSDYLTSGGALNSSSILVKAIGNSSTSTKGCLKPPSTSSWPDSKYMTYFAGAIYAAQTALQAEQAATTALGINANNAIIFVSDGQANMPYDGFPQKTSTAGTGGDSVTSAGTTKYTTTAANLTGVSTKWGTYPDSNADCQQAIMAAQYAQNAGTRFYAVAYGSESNGCVTDDGTLGSTQVVVTGTLNVPITSASQVVPCVVMEDMASPTGKVAYPWYFYTDQSSAANGCTNKTMDLNSIFGAIGATFTQSRLLLNTAT